MGIYTHYVDFVSHIKLDGVLDDGQITISIIQNKKMMGHATMASYVDSVIGSGEVVKYRAKISIWCMVPYILVGFAFIWVFGLGLLFWIAAFIRYKTTELVITDKKIIAKFGFIRRDTIEILLPKIESIQVKQSIFGRIFNYGSILVSGAGTPQAPVPGIDDPLRFRRVFMEVQERSTSAIQQQFPPQQVPEQFRPPQPPEQPQTPQQSEQSMLDIKIKDTPAKSKIDWTAKARECLSVGEFKEAVAACTMAIQNNAGGNEYYLRAVAYSKMKDQQKMRVDLEAAARLGHAKAIETMEKITAKI